MSSLLRVYRRYKVWIFFGIQIPLVLGKQCFGYLCWVKSIKFTVAPTTVYFLQCKGIMFIIFTIISEGDGAIFKGSSSSSHSGTNTFVADLADSEDDLLCCWS
eukprot:TRINITY_DN4100_c0_g1_i1.p1 TRINITY_DN4100_c0_g1~~TRINITY_DN4100_c0_g1_i1.p1  ORF type:complete len:103 (+),score=6.83 TRINITY_DN4100_c0_g1_i1:82-390(+)